MRQFFKKRKSLTILGFMAVFLILNGCMQDDFYNENQNNSYNKSGLKINRITGSKAKQLAGKFNIETLSGFTINSGTGMNYKSANTGTIKYDEILEVIDTLGNTNYTFRIEGHPMESERSFFNLVVNIKDGQQQSYILEYEMEEEFALDYSNGYKKLEQFDGNIKANVIELEFPCPEFEFPIKGGVGNNNPGDSNPNPGNGGQGINPGDSNQNPGSETGTNPESGISGGEDPILPYDPCPDLVCDFEDEIKEDCNCIALVSISPRLFKVGNNLVVENLGKKLANPNNPCADFELTVGVLEPNKKPCERLKDLLDPQKQNIKAEIEWLAQKFEDNEEVEFSSNFEKQGDFNDDDVLEYEYNTERIEGDSENVPINTGDNWYAAIHYHPRNGGVETGIFSWLDLTVLRDLYYGTNLGNQYRPSYRPDVTFMVLAPDPLDNTKYNVYAIKVESYATLEQKLNNDWNNPNLAQYQGVDRVREIHQELGKKYRENQNNLEKYFLQRFGMYGISLYKLNENDDWDKLELKNTINGLDVDPKPCN